MNSTHKVEVFKIRDVEAHPNADRLEIVRFYGYQTVVRKGDFKRGDLAAFVPPDSVVADTEQFAFLKGKLRIKACKLRGAVSQGLVIHAPAGLGDGDDAAEVLGITHYDPPPQSHASLRNATRLHNNQTKAPPVASPGYDLETIYKYYDAIPEGTLVEVTEKIDGCNARFLYNKGKFYCGSRQLWRADDGADLWWNVLHANKWLQRLCKHNPGHVVYGEVYGWVQSLRYGAKDGQYWFRVFDIYSRNRFLAPAERYAMIEGALAETLWDRVKSLFGYKVNRPSLSGVHVPIVRRATPYSFKEITKLAEGESIIANHIREGVVIKPLVEMSDPRIGRLALKAVSPSYLEVA